MTRYIVTPEAAEDIDKLLLYLAEHATERVVLETEDRIIDAFNLLARTPAIGHRRTDISKRPGIHFFLVKPYLIAFERDRKPIVIYGVLHSARDVKRVLRSRGLK